MTWRDRPQPGPIGALAITFAFMAGVTGLLLARAVVLFFWR